MSFGATPGADTATPRPPEEEEKKQNPFYFTRFAWGNSVSTHALGVGSLQGADGDQYLMNFGLNLRYYFLNQTFDKAYVNVHAGVGLEITNSNNTTTSRTRQPVLEDTIIGAGYSHTVYRSADKQWQTSPGISASFTLPTAPTSLPQGKYLGAGLTASVIQAVPLAGNKSDWFPDVLAFGTVGYSHTFSRCYTACNTNIAANNPRQAPDGTVAPSDQLGLSAIAPDKVKLNVTYFLTIYKDLSLANTWEISVPFKHQLPPTTIGNLGTGPVAIGASDRGSINPTTTFDVSLSYVFFNMARADIGYLNLTPELSDNAGGRVSVFYSPASVFYGNVSVYFDSIIDRVRNGPEKKKALAEGRFRPRAF